MTLTPCAKQFLFENEKLLNKRKHTELKIMLGDLNEIPSEWRLNDSTRQKQFQTIHLVQYDSRV